MENLTPSSLKKKFFDQLQPLLSSKKILIAYSGGLDSHVLLHLASQFKNKPYSVKMRAAHIHHGLQKEADHWVKHCQRVCDELDISLQVDYLNLTLKKGESTEAVARSARYAALKKTLQPDEILLTAHHQNDQAETLLLQLFRGAGVQGLAAMPLVSKFANSHHARPLLHETRESLEAYAQMHQLAFIEDPTNKDSAFDRNFLRNEIIPLLRERWPSIDKTISRSAAIQAETKHLLDEIADQDLSSIISVENNTLSLAKLSKLSFERQKLLLRYWISNSGFKRPSEKKLKHIFSDVVNSSDDAQPLLEWQGAQIRKYRNELYIMSPLLYHDNTQIIHWDNSQSLELASLNLTLEALDLGTTKNVTVRFRQGGEKMAGNKNGKHHTLKNVLQDAGVPPWLRTRVPLIYVDEALIKIVIND